MTDKFCAYCSNLSTVLSAVGGLSNWIIGSHSPILTDILLPTPSWFMHTSECLAQYSPKKLIQFPPTIMTTATPTPPLKCLYGASTTSTTTTTNAIYHHHQYPNHHSTATSTTTPPPQPLPQPLHQNWHALPLPVLHLYWHHHYRHYTCFNHKFSTPAPPKKQKKKRKRKSLH